MGAAGFSLLSRPSRSPLLCWGSALLPLIVLLEPLQPPLAWVRAIGTSSRWKGRVVRVWNGKEGRGAGGVIWAEAEDAATSP